MLYSKSAHATGTSSGFFFDDDKNAPKDSFSTSEADHMTAINLPAGSTYDFTAPVAPATAGTLVTTAPTPAYLLAQSQMVQLGILAAAYQAAISAPVSFTTKAGVTKTYQADAQAVANLQASIAGCMASGATPAGFFWVAADNTQAAFAYADLTGLAATIFAQGAAAFAHLQTQKAAVRAATTVAAVQAVVW